MKIKDNTLEEVDNDDLENGNFNCPQQITKIDSRAFYQCSNLRTLFLPLTITDIKSATFWRCTNLTTITLPRSIEEIGVSAFYGCTNLVSIFLPERLTKISNYLFYGCTNLFIIWIPTGITCIEHSAFDGCTSLRQIVIDSNDDKEVARVSALLPEAFRKYVVKNTYIDWLCQAKEALYPIDLDSDLPPKPSLLPELSHLIIKEAITSGLSFFKANKIDPEQKIMDIEYNP
ncbi:Uncharacterised protein [Legionella wadsworthii]|uniref:Leucine-rich repeat domain-containing protein n=1 Tax=Legionella wadsworthii TaxID=28088 RepID=A0A378LNL4_9GAMM|nr:leucine-rich repeat domain-containing protein [Legionella wadsworthii]STY28277.1 Uncharacterised protein [Legionella wadsworthii]